MRRLLHGFLICGMVGRAYLAAGVANGAVVGFYEMEIDDNPAAGLSVPDSSGTPGANPFTSGNATVTAPGAEGTANGVDGFNNVNGTILSYPALNSASLSVSGYWRTNESAAQLVGRTTAPTGTKGYSIESPNNVSVLFWVNSVMYTMAGGAGGLPGGPIDLSAGTIETPAWTKVAFSYDAVTGVADLLADDIRRGTLTVPGGGPIFVEGDEINVLVGNGAYPGGGFDGGDMAANTGGIVDQLRFDDEPASSGPPPVAGDVDGDRDVDLDDFAIIQEHFRTPVTTRMDGDLNGDRTVNFHDFRLWKSKFPTPPSAASAAVPEPSCLVLALVWLGGVCAFGARCKKRVGPPEPLALLPDLGAGRTRR